MHYLIIALAFVAGSLLIFGINLLLSDVFEAHRQRVRKRMQEELLARQREQARGSMAYKELYEMAAEGLTDVEESRSIISRFIKLVDESGMVMKPAQILMLAALCGAVPAGLVWLLSGNPIYVTIAGICGAVLPVGYVYIRRAQRMEKMLSQLPDAFDLMARTMRAGQTIAQAMHGVADEFSAPIGDEFRFSCEQQNLGLSPEASMRDLARRTGLLELKIFVLAVTIHRTTGGNMSELLDKLAQVIRERYRIRGAVRALTAEGRMQAIVLLAIPPVMMVILLVVNPDYMLTLFQYPALLVGMFVSMTIGALWMRAIVNFDF